MEVDGAEKRNNMYNSTRDMEPILNGFRFSKGQASLVHFGPSVRGVKCAGAGDGNLVDCLQ
jgi:hypothetical protein